jgi:hypothetical protein
MENYSWQMSPYLREYARIFFCVAGVGRKLGRGTKDWKSGGMYKKELMKNRTFVHFFHELL